MKIIVLLTLLMSNVFTLQAQWQYCEGIYGGAVSCLISDGNKIYCGTHAGTIYSSFDNGENWNIIKMSKKQVRIRSLASNGNVIIAVSDSMYRSTDMGKSWKNITKEFPDYSGLGYTNYLAINGSTVFITAGINVFKGYDYGETWARVEGSPALDKISEIVVYNNKLMTYKGKEIYISTDNGDVWSKSGEFNVIGSKLLADKNAVYALTPNHREIYRSIDDGKSWRKVGSALSDNMYSVAGIGNDLFLGTNNGVLRLRNNVSTVMLQNQGDVWAVTTHNSMLFAATNDGIIKSSDFGETWTSANNGLKNPAIYSLTSIENSIFVNTLINSFFSKDNGEAWSSSENIMNGVQINTTTEHNSKFFAGTSGNGIYFRTPNQSSWSQMKNNFLPLYVKSLVSNGKSLFALCSNDRYKNYSIYSSVDDGVSWHKIYENSNYYISYLVVSGNRIIANTSHGMLQSVNNGNTWTLQTLGVISNLDFLTNNIVSKNNIVCYCRNNEILYSTDNGNNWNYRETDFSQIEHIACSETEMFVVTRQYYSNKSNDYRNDIYVSKDFGITWRKLNSELMYISMIQIFQDQIYIGTYLDGLWKQDVREVTSEIAIPREFIQDNITVSPNPNKGTFTIPSLSQGEIQVQIELYSMQGLKVYERQWYNSSESLQCDDLGNGVYMLICRTDNTIRTALVSILK